MTTMQDLLGSTLKSQGYSLTQPRLTVFEVLQDAEPLTMHELVLACGDKLDRASVYRTVALFEAVGIVQKVYIGWKYRLELTDTFDRHHHHISCSQCGTVVALHEDAAVESMLLQMAKQHGFTAESHQLEIRGRCANCQA